MEIISCHGYQSSFDVIGWIHAASGSLGWPAGREAAAEEEGEEGETDGDKLFRFWRSDAAPARICSVRLWLLTNTLLPLHSLHSFQQDDPCVGWEIIFCFLQNSHEICKKTMDGRRRYRNRAGMRAKVHTDWSCSLWLVLIFFYSLSASCEVKKQHNPQ